ncbi:unnamed protein product [Peronospora effusa]|nr:unnamed protein product [Peronospora effusa]
MEEKALAVREKCNAIQEQVTAKERRLRKDESKYRKLKEYDGMASAEVDLSNNLESCEEMMEENAKKRHTGKQNSRLSIQLSARSKNTVRVFSRMNQIFPLGSVERRARMLIETKQSMSKKEEHIEDEDSNEEE